VGSTTGVVKYDGLLIQQAFYPTNFAVYDVAINTNGELLACGGTYSKKILTESYSRAFTLVCMFLRDAGWYNGYVVMRNIMTNSLNCSGDIFALPAIFSTEFYLPPYNQEWCI
jgi:hypothetical protein